MLPAKDTTTPEERLRAFGEIVGRLIRKEDISRAEARECWRQICAGEQPEMQQGAFIAALAAKPETLEEVAGTFDALYEYDTIKVEIDTPEPFIDNAGTGGDTLKTFNVSTAAAIVAAACGLYVVRHCSRATSSNCGAIDVLQALGINVESGPELPKQSIERVGICAWNAFLPWLHPRFLGRMPARIRFVTTINFVGPLLSPTMPSYKVMGVKSPESVDFESRLLGELGFKRAFVMHGLNAAGEGGMDEFSTLGPSHVAELRPDGSIDKSVITPEELGLRVARYEDIASSRDVHREALTLLRVIAGKDAGAREDIVCLNAAPLLYVRDRVKDLNNGIAMARAAIRDGRALQKLRDWAMWQNSDREVGLVALHRLLEQL
jgi:anthranilate phosphoribosyltransferase